MALHRAPGSFFYVLEDALRILYVDDDPILREFAVVHLASDTAQVRTAEDGRRRPATATATCAPTRRPATCR